MSTFQLKHCLMAAVASITMIAASELAFGTSQCTCNGITKFCFNGETACCGCGTISSQIKCCAKGTLCTSGDDGDGHGMASCLQDGGFV